MQKRSYSPCANVHCPWCILLDLRPEGNVSGEPDVELFRVGSPGIEKKKHCKGHTWPFINPESNRIRSWMHGGAGQTRDRCRAVLEAVFAHYRVKKTMHLTSSTYVGNRQRWRLLLSGTAFVLCPI